MARLRDSLDARLANASSLHGEGRAARRALEDAREQVAGLLGAQAREIIFTSGATEANNTALRGIRHADGSVPTRVLVSAVEHPSVLQPASALGQQGRCVEFLPVDGEGRLDLTVLEEKLEQGPALVACMMANNEVGTLQPWREIAERCAGSGSVLHLDGAQWVGKLPLSVEDLPCPTTLSLSGHKFGGLQGTGALYVRLETRLDPALLGGGQERLRRAGTENLLGAIALGEACGLALGELDDRAVIARATARSLLDGLTAVSPNLELNGPGNSEDRVPGLMNLRFPGVPAETLMFALDLHGVAVSVGAACSSGSVEPSHVLTAMGRGKVENLESVRVSCGWHHAEEEMRRAIGAFARALESNPK